jgi:hypothetical protein
LSAYLAECRRLIDRYWCTKGLGWA